MILNNLAFALSDTATYWIKEGVGILASVFVLVSFLFSNERKTRIINIVGAAIFVAYGLILPAYATSVMNGALIIVHIVKLVQSAKQAKNARNKEDSENQPSAETKLEEPVKDNIAEADKK